MIQHDTVAEELSLGQVWRPHPDIAGSRRPIAWTVPWDRVSRGVWAVGDREQATPTQFLRYLVRQCQDRSSVHGWLWTPNETAWGPASYCVGIRRTHGRPVIRVPFIPWHVPHDVPAAEWGFVLARTLGTVWHWTITDVVRFLEGWLAHADDIIAWALRQSDWSPTAQTSWRLFGDMPWEPQFATVHRAFPEWAQWTDSAAIGRIAVWYIALAQALWHTPETPWITVVDSVHQWGPDQAMQLAHLTQTGPVWVRAHQVPPALPADTLIYFARWSEAAQIDAALIQRFGSGLWQYPGLGAHITALSPHEAILSIPGGHPELLDIEGLL